MSKPPSAPQLGQRIISLTELRKAPCVALVVTEENVMQAEALADGTRVEIGQVLVCDVSKNQEGCTLIAQDHPQGERLYYGEGDEKIDPYWVVGLNLFEAKKPSETKKKRKASKIKPDKLLKIVQESAQELELPIPEGLEADLKTHLADVRLRHASDLPQKLCPKLSRIFETDEQLSEKYQWWAKLIANDVRFKLALALGFKKTIEQVNKKTGCSDRKLLKDFLLSLEPGQSWSYTDLSSWQKDSPGSGQKLYNRIKNRAGFDEQVIRFILGKKADKLLAQNPFVPRTEINNLRDARRYLIAFLQTLTPGQTWRIQDLLHWTNGSCSGGKALHRWIAKHFPEGFEESSIRLVLGNQAEECLKVNPFVREFTANIITIRDAKRHLGIFLKTLDEGESWSYKKLTTYRNLKTGVGGIAIKSWIQERIRMQDNEFCWKYALKKLLTPQQLKRNPFTHYGEVVDVYNEEAIAA